MAANAARGGHLHPRRRRRHPQRRHPRRRHPQRRHPGGIPGGGCDIPATCDISAAGGILAAGGTHSIAGGTSARTTDATTCTAPLKEQVKHALHLEETVLPKRIRLSEQAFRSLRRLTRRRSNIRSASSMTTFLQTSFLRIAPHSMSRAPRPRSSGSSVIRSTTHGRTSRISP